MVKFTTPSISVSKNSPKKLALYLLRNDSNWNEVKLSKAIENNKEIFIKLIKQNNKKNARKLALIILIITKLIIKLSAKSNTKYEHLYKRWNN